MRISILVAAFLLLCASTAGAQMAEPPFPLVVLTDTAGLHSSLLQRARVDAASLALPWLRDTEHPAFDSIDFPPGLITSLQNALVQLATTYDIPALDSARSFKITPRYWESTTEIIVTNLKKSPWVMALFKGKKKTGNKMIDTLAQRYGLRVASIGSAYTKDVPVTLAIDSLVNIRALNKKIYAMEGVDSFANFSSIQHGWKTVKVSVVDGKWRFEYEFVGEVKKLGWNRFTWLFDVSSDGSVTHVRSEHEPMTE